MTKNDKKTDNAICQVLTEACETDLKQHQGFEWVTHVVNYKRFPQSLLVICIFDNKAHLAHADVQALRDSIMRHLLSVNIRLAQPQRQISFDTEEACAEENDGNWARRLACN